jgi:hypothetical protein
MEKLLITPQGTFTINLTAEEIAENEQNAIQAQQNETARIAKEQQEQANKQSALNKLKALGLTDAEITALIG